MSAFSSGAYALGGAIASTEGFGIAGALPTTSNNPGDLFEGDVGYGTASNGETIFGSLSAGFDALYAQAQKMISGGSNVYNPNETIGQAAAQYSGNDANAATNWLSFLGNGLTANSPLSAIGNVASGITNLVAPGAMDALESKAASLIPGYGSGVWTLENIMILLIGFVLVIIGLLSFKDSVTNIVLASPTTSGALQGASLASKAAGKIKTGTKQLASMAAESVA